MTGSVNRGPGIAGPVISVSGPPGSGKTTLCTAVARSLGIAVIEYDRHERMTSLPPEQIRDWLDRGAPYEEIAAPGLAPALAAAAAKGPVLFDTPLGRAHPHSGGAIDAAVWLDCPPDIALARKVKQFASEANPAEAADFIEWLRQYLAVYPQIIRPACAIQAERIRPGADLLIDVSDDAGPADQALESFVRAVISRKRFGA